jgi:hypothetical protein
VTGGSSPQVGTFQGQTPGSHTTGAVGGLSGSAQITHADPTSGATANVSNQVPSTPNIQGDLQSRADVSSSVPSVPSPEAELRGKAPSVGDPQSQVEGAVGVGDPSARVAQAQSSARADVQGKVSVEDPRDRVSGVENQARVETGRAAEVRATVNDPTGAAQASVTGAASGVAAEHGVTKAESDVRQAHTVVTDPATAATDEARARAAAKERELKPDVNVSADVKVDVDPTKK